jgi:hypothetical protein
MSLDDHLRTGGKTLIATVLLQLVDEEKAEARRHLSRFNPGLASPKEQRTAIRELAEMRSGMIDVDAIPAVQTENSVARQKARLTCLRTGAGNLCLRLCRLVRLYRRHHGLQYRSLPHARDRCDNYRLCEQPAGEPLPAVANAIFRDIARVITQ